MSPWTPTPSTSVTATCGPRPGSPLGSTSRSALVADDHGHSAAATVARRLVVYLQRSGGQAQFSALLAGQAADTEPVRDLLSWLRDHLTADLSVAALARQVNLSERQFTRVFKSEVGVTAAGYVEAVRLDSACRLLETTNRTIAQIAKTCGFGTPETMNRTFRRRLNTTPGDHRHHFRGDRSPVASVTPQPPDDHGQTDHHPEHDEGDHRPLGAVAPPRRPTSLLIGHCVMPLSWLVAGDPPRPQVISGALGRPHREADQSRGPGPEGGDLLARSPA